jgi:hypothetical protein
VAAGCAGEQQRVDAIAEIKVALQAIHRHIQRQHRTLRRREREFAHRRAIQDAVNRKADALSGDLATPLQRGQRNIGRLRDPQRD